MRLAVINDNSKKRELWEEFCPGITSYKNPTQAFFEKRKDPSLHFDAIILDREFHECDAVEDGIMDQLKAIFHGVKILISSQHHVKGEHINGAHKVIDQWPVDLEELESYLNSHDKE